MTAHKKLFDNGILVIGVIIFSLFLLLPEPDSPWMVSVVKASLVQDCSTLFCTATQRLTKIFWTYLGPMEVASSTLKGKGGPSDLAQDIVGFRALVAQRNPYPVLGPAFRELGLEWEIEHASTHPPMAFLFVAPVAFLSWNWASAVWAWLMLVLCVFAFRCYGTSWKAAVGLTPIILLWPPVATSLGQLTILWLFALAVGYRFEEKGQFWSGVSIGLAALTRFFPGLLVGSFILKRQWRALLGFVSIWIVFLSILMLLHPNSIGQYVQVNRSTSQDMIQRVDNASPLFNSYRFGSWIGVVLLLFLFLVIVWVNRDCFYRPKLFVSSRLWILLSFFSVVLLPISWIYSMTPLLPVILLLISRKKLSTMIVGCCCLAIPCFIPAFGPATVLPLMLVNLLVGIGLLFDGLPYRLFTAVSLKDLGMV